MLSSTKEREKVVHGGAQGPGLDYMMPIVCAKAWSSLTKPAAGQAGENGQGQFAQHDWCGCMCLWVILLAACLAVLMLALSVVLLLTLRSVPTLNRPWV